MTVATRRPPARGATRAVGRPGFRLRGRGHKVALTAHILTSVGWFGVALVVALGGIVGSLTGDAGLRRGIYRMLELVPWLSIPIGLAAVATGVVLGLGTAHGVFRRWWVVVKIAISAAVVVTDAVGDRPPRSRGGAHRPRRGAVAGRQHRPRRRAGDRDRAVGLQAVGSDTVDPLLNGATGRAGWRPAGRRRTSASRRGP